MCKGSKVFPSVGDNNLFISVLLKLLQDIPFIAIMQWRDLKPAFQASPSVYTYHEK